MSYLKIKSNLLFITIIPLLFVITLSSIILYEMHDNKKSLEFIKNRILEAEALSKVIHNLQIERGLTAGFVASSNLDENEKNLIAAKNDSNRAIENAKHIYLNVTKNRDSVIFELLDSLYSRDTSYLINMQISSARNYYTKNISELLKHIKSIPALMDDKENRNFIQSYSNLASAKEALGQIRATMMEIFSTNMLMDEDFISIKGQLREYNLNIENFKIITPPKLLNYYNKNFSKETVEDTFEIIEAVLNNRNIKDFNLEPDYWFKTATNTIDALKKVEDELFACVERSISQKLDSLHYKIAVLLVILGISAIIVTILMLLAITRILSSADKLKKEHEASLLLLEQYKSTVDRSFIVSKTDPEGVITYANDEFCKISGYSREELIGKRHSIVRDPDTKKEFYKELWHTIKDLKQPWIGEMKNRDKNGMPYWQQAIINPILDTRGNVVEYIAIRVDITQQKEIANYFEDQQKISSKNFKFSMHLSREYEKAIDASTILLRVDRDENITYANNKFLNITEYTLNEILGKSYRILSLEDIDEAFYTEIKSTIASGAIWHGTIKSKTKSGKDFWTKTTIIPIKDLNSEIIEYLAISNDITELIKQKKESERIARTDILTGCGNRFRLNSDMRELDNLAVAIFNIDNFRQINDFYGHQFGDLIIKSIADKIYTQVVKEKNLRFYRLQGDEFIALAENYSKEMLIQKAKNILDVIKEKFIIQNKDILISCSCGISFEDKEHLLSTANMALKIAKRGSADLVVYDESISLNSEYENNIFWTKKLSDAIKEDRITAYYQPIVNNKTLVYEKYECLVRMIDEDKVISPFLFLEVAKQTRQYFYITRTVIYEAFEMFKDKEVEFSINLSLMDILEKEICEYIFMMLEKYGIGSRVVFEIVESEYIENFEGVISFINEVRKYDAKIAIDDFGTGYSNFGYLIKLKADYLKIDGSLIKNIDTDKNAFLIVSTIVEFSKKLGMKTIAEFVENEKIFKIVKDLGIDYSQGYYFSAAKKDIV